jgi:CRP/FNR family transcriptional regulator, cyclic AMP receptor protein
LNIIANMFQWGPEEMNTQVLDRKTFHEGQSVFEQGETGTSAYIIQDGEVQIVKNADNEDTILGSIGKGGIFGEMALVDDQPRMARAEATMSTTVIVISREIFNQKLQKTDPFIRGLLNIFVDTIRHRN